MFPIIKLSLFESRLNNSYVVAFCKGKITGLKRWKCIVIVACDEMKIQMFVMCLSDVVDVV